jgi:Cu2+-exporting ATPase
MEPSIKKSFPVTGLSCASCAINVESILKNQEGVVDANVNYAASTVLLEYIPTTGILNEFKKSVQSIGYDILIDEKQSSKRAEQILKESDKLKHKTIRAALLTLPVVVIAMFLMKMPYANWIMLIFSTPVVFWYGRGFFINAWRQLRHGMTNMDSLVALSTGIAWTFSFLNTLFPHLLMPGSTHPHVYFEASAVIIVFILLGKMLEERAKSNTSSAIRKLMGLQPNRTTLVNPDGTETDISVSDIMIDTLLRVKPGERIPTDGDITDGVSYIDESTITGEPMPTEKQPGDHVFAGTINQKGSFVMKAVKVGSETLLARIIQMVQEAQGSKPPVQKLVDKIAAIFVPAVIGLSIISFTLWMLLGGPHPLTHALLAMVSVLIIACPCALGLATPTAIMVGIGKGAEQGILIKDADGLELANQIDVIVLDKTGTITEGKPVVTDWKWRSENTHHLKQVLYSIESRSEHPLAEAIIKTLDIESIKPIAIDHFESITGRGLIATIKGIKYALGNEALMTDSGIDLTEVESRIINELHEQAKTVLYFGGPDKIHAIIAIADNIKSSSPKAIERLKSMGIEVHMLTGDNQQTARSVSQQTGIDIYKAGLLPNEKAEYIKQLQKQGKIVAMVGDGINDSHAMAQADVSFAMGQGSDIAMDVAKMTISSPSLDAIPSAIILSRQTIRTIRQNLFWAFIYNIIGIPIAAGLLYPFNGFLLNPMIAGGAMALSSVSVVSNSLRLKFMNLKTNEKTNRYEKFKV